MSRVVGAAEFEFGEIVNDACLRAILFVDLQDAGVLMIACRKNPGWFARQKNSRVGAVTIDEAAANVKNEHLRFLVDRLAAKGLVERRICEEDRRARYAALIPAGEKLMQRIFPEHAAMLQRALGALSPDEQVEATALLRQLGRAAAELEPGAA